MKFCYQVATSDVTFSPNITAYQGPVEESFAVITLSDTGCGISEEELPDIFRRAYTTRGEKGGQGLGLAITRTIILAHAGQIEVSSKKGEGTTFIIRLPLLS